MWKCGKSQCIRMGVYVCVFVGLGIGHHQCCHTQSIQPFGLLERQILTQQKHNVCGDLTRAQLSASAHTSRSHINKNVCSHANCLVAIISRTVKSNRRHNAIATQPILIAIYSCCCCFFLLRLFIVCQCYEWIKSIVQTLCMVPHACVFINKIDTNKCRHWLNDAEWLLFVWLEEECISRVMSAFIRISLWKLENELFVFVIELYPWK